ncbi:unnamed protein product [Kuraishia capsulata CBS 1993]|uniref:Catalase n=1 Tax=Kuraishia capsulata CBS 1993 TaxID=1382522 RepID=W6ML45_9ASCO|nr:uncharacterized protein KUCA_T00003148001 [Kuraishia capsulata CBS 1993]CDK27171.1 unnamed protein product [Kuraishia capsulata CBS 1993]
MSGPPTYTTSQGCPVAHPFATDRVAINTKNYKTEQAPTGPLLLQDFTLIDSLAHFDRERIPERVVHAKGGGAFGYFEVTDNITDLVSSKFLDTVGKKTKSFVRFSTVGGEKGSSDTARDPRGFAIKLYTEEGNLDWVYNNTPIFFLRDPSKFPHFIHTQKRNPQTNLKDANMFWDYICNNQEAVHQIMYMFTDRGTPVSWRHMNGYSGHTYKWYNANGDWKYVQVHLIADGGVKNFNVDEAGELDGKNPDHNTQDLFQAIERGDNPSWTAYVQTMTQEQASKLPFSVFDLTKVWPHKDFPLRRFGKLVLNENPKNYFAEVEQAAFSPSHTVPGQQASADPVLQSRLFSYPDTHRHRLGTNYVNIPVNCPVKPTFAPNIRDGAMTTTDNLGATPNYANAYDQPVKYAETAKTSNKTPEETFTGEVVKFHWGVVDYDYVQPRALWQKVLAKQPGGQATLVKNLSGHVANANEYIQDRVFELFGRVDPKLGEQLRDAVLKISPRGESVSRL